MKSWNTLPTILPAIKLAIVGSRNSIISLDEAVGHVCDFISAPILEIVSGGAKEGGDLLARLIKDEFNIPYIEFYPEYEKFDGRIAPIQRNTTIANYCTHLIAFWDGYSKGTADVLTKARKFNKQIKIVNT